MKKVNLTVAMFSVLLLAVSIVGCGNNKNTETAISKTFGIFTVSDNGLTAKVEGTIVDTSLQDFHKMMVQYPNLQTLDLVDVPGSDVSGDLKSDMALDLGREVYQKNINTHLVDNGFVASGGTDLLASGKSVTVGNNPEIGVHAWGGGFEDNPNASAWDIKDDESHIEHQKYLRYYEDIGFSKQKAKDFYFFTIRSRLSSKLCKF
ncbi:MAG: hypothetical protein CSA42_00730 [Gammaproteobacteria bacterium]|nr:MAG: hypothetical protein CSA42_00730 [Gammaproteobacteria bacterium]